MIPFPHILLVDDDAEITALLSEYLSTFNLVIHVACDGDSMRAQLARHPIDLVVLDVMLPGVDGLVLSREIRQHSSIPVIMLTARSSAFDRVMGLENGADDYVTKPFEPRELVARIHTVLRRSGPARNGAPNLARSDVVCFDGWELHREDRCLTSPTGLVVPLSNAEFSRDQWMAHARGRAMDAFERSIDLLLVSRLRLKLVDDRQEPSMNCFFSICCSIACLADWVGARWLSEPIRGLAGAARELGRDIHRQRDPFVAAVSHDLRTPLTRLALRAEALQGVHERQAFTRDIQEMEEMIRATLDYLRGAADPEPFVSMDMGALVTSCG